MLLISRSHGHGNCQVNSIFILIILELHIQSEGNLFYTLCGFTSMAIHNSERDGNVKVVLFSFFPHFSICFIFLGGKGYSAC